MNTLDLIIPAPLSVTKDAGQFPLGDLKRYCLEWESPAIRQELAQLQEFFQLRWEVSGTSSAQLTIRENRELGAECWNMRITRSGVVIEGGDHSGVLYGVSAFAQMVTGAMWRGDIKRAMLNCGVISDAPRFPWRSFMLDCARHFQSPAAIKGLIRIMAHLRLNRLHLHLTDDQGWRLDLQSAPKMTGDGRWSDGQYTADDLRNIVEYAQDYGIQVVPEIDVPGHSAALLRQYPQFACDQNNVGREFCLGNPAAREFLKGILAEVMAIFNSSPYIHLGGGEAELDHWSACPKCQAALVAGGFRSLRELECDFMKELISFVGEQGRTPILWGNACSEQIYPADTVIQAWFNIQEIGRIQKDGNKIINSVQHSLYFDFPEKHSEAAENWMFDLSEAGIYRTEPYVAWEGELKANDQLMGTEACLWTERVPEWRLLPKVLPRIYAYAECAWSSPDRKNWYDFLQRKEVLETAGYQEFLRKTLQ